MHTNSKECECAGLKQTLQLMRFYHKTEGRRTTDPEKREASQIAKSLLNSLDSVPPSYRHLTKQSEEDLRKTMVLIRTCAEEGHKSISCIYALETIRNLLHQDPGACQALVCGPPYDDHAQFDPNTGEYAARGNLTDSAIAVSKAHVIMDSDTQLALDLIESRIKDATCESPH